MSAWYNPTGGEQRLSFWLNGVLLHYIWAPGAVLAIEDCFDRLMSLEGPLLVSVSADFKPAQETEVKGNKPTKDPASKHEDKPKVEVVPTSPKKEKK